MPPQTLRFNELKPERDHFELEDETKIEFIARAEMGPEDFRRFRGLLERVVRTSNRASGKRGLLSRIAKTDEAAALEAGAALDDAIRFLLPKILPGVLASLGIDQKTKILEWWQERNLPKAGQGKARPD